jgi:excisionase family DNA binding protein
MNDNRPAAEQLTTSQEVAAAFRVDVKTAIKWAQAGKLPSFKTPGGGWRFRESEVRALLTGGQQ